MKKLFLFLFSSFLFQFGFAQIDFASFDKQLKQSSDTARKRMMSDIGWSLIFSKPDSAIKICLQYKSHFEQLGNTQGEAYMLNRLSLAFQSLGDNQQAAALGLSSLKLFEAIKDTNGIISSINAISIAIGYNGDWQTALVYQKRMLEYSRLFKNAGLEALAHANTGDCYLRLKRPDSALQHVAASLDYSSKINDPYYLGGDFRNFGIYYKQKNMYDLSLVYFRDAKTKYDEANDLFDIADVSNFTAEVYFLMHQYDSSIIHANMAIMLSRQNNFNQYLMDGYTWLYKNYEQLNRIDSSFKYLKLSLSTKDSIANEDKKRKIQSLVFAEQLRQQEKELQLQRVEEQRKRNLQYSFIGLSIVIFLILFFLLSRSIIVNEKWISFLGILGLLLVFEFINLLIHPFLEEVTHHNPIIMLLALVGIASLLIPLHHRIEKWIKLKMTEKNKAIRLAAAKKTIEKLEKKSK